MSQENTDNTCPLNHEALQHFILDQYDPPNTNCGLCQQQIKDRTFYWCIYCDEYVLCKKCIKNNFRWTYDGQGEIFITNNNSLKGFDNNGFDNWANCDKDNKDVNYFPNPSDTDYDLFYKNLPDLNDNPVLIENEILQNTIPKETVSINESPPKTDNLQQFRNQLKEYNNLPSLIAPATPSISSIQQEPQSTVITALKEFNQMIQEYSQTPTVIQPATHSVASTGVLTRILQQKKTQKNCMDIDNDNETVHCAFCDKKFDTELLCTQHCMVQHCMYFILYFFLDLFSCLSVF